MGNQTGPFRSFNTLRHSNREERSKRQLTAKYVMLSIFSVLLAILVVLAVFVVCSMANKGNESGEHPKKSTDAEAITVKKSFDEIHIGTLLIVNKDHLYLFPASDRVNVSQNLKTTPSGTQVCLLKSNTLELERAAMDAFNEMMQKYVSVFGESDILRMTDAYRTKEEQAKAQLAPGYSDHHTGYLLALKTRSDNDLESTHWMYKNCYKYGFIVRYPESKSAITGVKDYTNAFRYVGIPHADYIFQNGLCLEEYVEMLKKYSFENPLTVEASDGHTYDIYYTAAQIDGETDLKIPNGCSYTVSGDNIGGFIVTADLGLTKAE